MSPALPSLEVFLTLLLQNNDSMSAKAQPKHCRYQARLLSLWEERFKAQLAHCSHSDKQALLTAVSAAGTWRSFQPAGSTACQTCPCTCLLIRLTSEIHSSLGLKVLHRGSEGICAEECTPLYLCGRCTSGGNDGRAGNVVPTSSCHQALNAWRESPVLEECCPCHLAAAEY